MRGGLYAALIAINLDQTDFDNGCDVRQATAIKPRIADLPKLCDVKELDRQWPKHRLECLAAQGVATARGRRRLEQGRCRRWVSVAPCSHMGHARHRPKRLAEKLIQIREALGLSQREMAERLAERAGVEITYKNISKYEQKKSVPPMEVVLAYARAGRVQMESIIDDEVSVEKFRKQLRSNTH